MPANCNSSVRAGRMKATLLIAVVFLGGCFEAHRDLTFAVHRCETVVDCAVGQRCQQISLWRYPICFDVCDARTSSRCESGAFCAPVPEGGDLCLPGAGYPDSAPVTPDCSSGYFCPFGDSCRIELGASLGVCEPVCGRDEDCGRGSACHQGVCHQLCDVRVADSCPPGFGCTYDGECKPATELADCPPRGSPDCPIGMFCFGGAAADVSCEDRSDPGLLGNCPPDQQHFVNNRCYPRSDLRPVR
jgi:hypothetical protein